MDHRVKDVALPLPHVETDATEALCLTSPCHVEPDATYVLCLAGVTLVPICSVSLSFFTRLRAV